MPKNVLQPSQLSTISVLLSLSCFAALWLSGCHAKDTGPHFYAPVTTEATFSPDPATPQVSFHPHTLDNRQIPSRKGAAPLAGDLPKNWAPMNVSIYIPFSRGGSLHTADEEAWMAHLSSPSKGVSILHAGWETAAPDPKATTNTWHETLWLLPAACAKLIPPVGEAAFDFKSSNALTCEDNAPVLLAEVPDYSLPYPQAKPQDARHITNLAFSPDEHDLLFDCEGKHYRMRLPVWAK